MWILGCLGSIQRDKLGPTNTHTSLDNGSDDGSSGLYRSTLMVPRVQQFSLRFSF
jgi:hypothetical protein